MKNEGKIWTLEEYEFLNKFYPMYGSEYCAERLFRHKKAIVNKANKLKIKFNGTRYKYSKENLEPIVLNSKNIKEVLDKMKLRAAGGNYRVINDYIKKYNINTTHFETQSDRIKKIKNQFIKVPIENFLVENSTCSRTNLKDRLYREGLKIRKCEECGQDEIWRGKKMSLILDHINGIHNDNRIENLRILCPNCNSTLETHAGKNNKKKNDNKSKKIRREIEKKEKSNIKKEYTKKRLLIGRRIVQRPPLKQLLEEISELGYVTTGRKYGVSDNAVRKWVKSYKKYGY